MDDASFRRILDFFRLSWKGYRRVRKGVKKRLARHMGALGLKGVDEYLVLLARNASEAENAKRLLTVSISRFFRNRRLWDILRESVLPDLAASSPQGFRVWCAGCACGEEVYSLKIAWSEMTGFLPCMPPMEIWATDINPQVIEIAKKGEYGKSSFREVAPLLMEKYFVKAGDHYRVSEALQRRIHWECGDFVSDGAPVPSLALVFLRNSLLTYHAEDTVREVFQRVVDNMRGGGYLIVGNHEEIPVTEVPMRRIMEYRGIWQRWEPDGE